MRDKFLIFPVYTFTMPCGIGGFITDYPFGEHEVQICKNLITSLLRRGTDAWGFFDGENVYKAPGDFRKSPYYNRLPEILTGKTLFLCHTRLATVGNPENNDNNHPFWLHPFVFAHNGGIFYADDFYNEWGIETDSFSLLYWIWREYQINPDTPTAISNGTEHVAGGYACWLWNFDDKATYLFRNHYYPCVTVYTRGTSPGGNFLIFGSDAQSIFDALQTKKVKIYNIKPYKIYKVVNAKITQVGSFKGKALGLFDEFRLLGRYHRDKPYVEETLRLIEEEVIV